VINNGKNITAIVTILQRAHQIDVKVREPPLVDRDVQGLCPGMAMNLALLAVQAGFGPGCHILGKTVLDISRSNKPLEASLPG
jgi:hypothetical protein